MSSKKIKVLQEKIANNEPIHEKEFDKLFGGIIKDWHIDIDLDQKEVADTIGMDANKLSRIERGDAHIKVFDLLLLYKNFDSSNIWIEIFKTFDPDLTPELLDTIQLLKKRRPRNKELSLINHIIMEYTENENDE